MAAGFEEFESSKAYAGATYAPDPSRYPDPARTSAAVRRNPDPSDLGEAGLFARQAADAREGQDEQAKFVMMDMASKLAKLGRAVKAGDEEATAALTSELDGFVDEHHDGLVPWVPYLERAGADGRRRASMLNKVLSGTYKEEYGAQELLDGTSEEYKSKKAGRLALELSVSTDAARAMIDRDHPRYSVFSAFSDLAKPATTEVQPAPTGPGRPTRATRANFLRGVAGLESAIGKRFESDGDMASFVAAFDQFVNKDGMYAGDAALQKVAKGFLADPQGTSAHDYVARYGELVDRISDQAVGGSSAKNATAAERRMARHEANEIVSEYLSMLGARADPVGFGPEQASAIESAASTVRMANDMFGVSSRGGANYARRVASVALASQGYSGVDDGGLLRMVSDGASDLSTLVSPPTRDLLARMADGKGQAHVGTVKAQYPYSNLEMFAVKALGRAVSKLSEGVDGSLPSGTSWGALKQFANGNDTAASKLKQAMADALDTRFGNRAVSMRVADGMVDRFLGRSSDGRTIEERVRELTGDFDPVTGEPKIPDAVRLGPNMPDAAFNGIMATMAGDPSKVIPSLKGDDGFSTAASKFAVRTVDMLEQNKDLESDPAWHKLLGGLLGAAGASDPAGLVESGWLTGFSRKGGPKSLGGKDLRFFEGAVKELAENVLSHPREDFATDPMLLNQAITLAVLARGPEWKGFLSALAGFPPRGGGVIGWVDVKRGGETLSRARVLSELVNSALAAVGVGEHASLGTALTTLSAVPSYEMAPLVSSGLVSKGDSPVSYKRFLATLQQEAFADKYTEKKGGSTPLQEAARRIYRSFGSRDDVLAKLKSDVLEHFRADGAEEGELMRLDQLLSNELVDHYRNGGPVAAEKLAQKRMGMSRWYLPVIDPKSRSVDPSRVRVTEYMTEEEYKAEVRRMQEVAKASGMAPELYSDAVFFNTNVGGLSTFRHNTAMNEKVRLAGALHAVKNDESGAGASPLQ